MNVRDERVSESDHARAGVCKSELIHQKIWKTIYIFKYTNPLSVELDKAATTGEAGEDGFPLFPVSCLQKVV